MSQLTARRQFLKTSAVAAATTLAVAPAVHAAGGDMLKIGLIGCGGRGTGAASQALRADKNVKLTAMADVFPDRLQFSLATLQKDQDIANKIDVPTERMFVGFDAYQKVLASGVDVVLLTTPPHFRPAHLKAAVEAGKHVFAEKPVAVDAPGVRDVLASCEAAKKKGISLVSGLCLRSDFGFRETVRRIHGGSIGEVIALQANDYRGSNWGKKREPGWTDMQYQMRNWYNFTWMSGDFNVEQHVHYLDVCAWVMQDQYPVSAVGLGGRQVRTKPEFGHIYDHFSIVYEYKDGAKFFSNCPQIPGCRNDMSANVLGSKGRAQLNERKNGLTIKSQDTWTYGGPLNDMYQTEHDEMFAAIRNGKLINNGEYMTRSTLLAIMGRMAAYTGRQITWDMAMNSKEVLGPKTYDWNAKLEEPPVAMPGVTQFV